MNTFDRRLRRFTQIELLFFVAIIGLLASLLIPNIAKASPRDPWILEQAAGVGSGGSVTDAPPAPPNFFQSVGGYFTSFNTNNLGTFGRNKVQLATGVDSLQGNGTLPLANSLRLGYNLIQPNLTPTNTTGFVLGPESVTRNSGVAGTIVSQQVGVKAGFVVVDTEIHGYVDGGYNFFNDPNTKQKIFCEFGVRIQKALTLNTFAGIGLGEQVPINRQIGELFGGFSF